MRRSASRLFWVASSLATIGALATASCAHPATERVLEPSGAAGSSSPAPSNGPSTPLADAGVSPAEPIATAIAPMHAEPVDFHVVRAPEFGDRVERRAVDIFAASPAAAGVGGTNALPPGGAGAGGAGAMGGTGGGIFR